MHLNKKDIENIAKYTQLFEKYEHFLTQNQRQIFKLYFFEDLSYAEIAEIMATTRTSAYDAVKKAINKLENTQKKMEQE